MAPKLKYNVDELRQFIIDENPTYKIIAKRFKLSEQRSKELLAKYRKELGITAIETAKQQARDLATKQIVQGMTNSITKREISFLEKLIQSNEFATSYLNWLQICQHKDLEEKRYYNPEERTKRAFELKQTTDIQEKIAKLAGWYGQVNLNIKPETVIQNNTQINVEAEARRAFKLLNEQHFD